MSGKMRFRVIKASHYSGGKRYRAGDVVESAVDLCEKFEGKFEKLSPVAPVPAPVEEIPQQGSGGDEPAGTDVSSRFNVDGYAVFLVDKKYFVYEEDNMGVALNKKPLKKAEVVEFINDLAE